MAFRQGDPGYVENRDAIVAAMMEQMNPGYAGGSQPYPYNLLGGNGAPGSYNADPASMGYAANMGMPGEGLGLNVDPGSNVAPGYTGFSAANANPATFADTFAGRFSDFGTIPGGYPATNETFGPPTPDAPAPTPSPSPAPAPSNALTGQPNAIDIGYGFGLGLGDSVGMGFGGATGDGTSGGFGADVGGPGIGGSSTGISGGPGGTGEGGANTGEGGTGISGGFGSGGDSSAGGGSGGGSK